MTYAEYENNINSALKDFDKAPAIMSELLNTLKSDITTKDTLECTVKELNSKIADLRDTNMKLFLSQTGGSKETKDEEETEKKYGKDAVDEFVKTLTGKGGNK